MKWKFSLLLLAFYKVATQKVGPNLSLFGEKKKKSHHYAKLCRRTFPSRIFFSFSITWREICPHALCMYFHPCKYSEAIWKQNKSQKNRGIKQSNQSPGKCSLLVNVSLWVSQWLKICAASCSAECYDVTIHQGGNP